MGPVSLAELCSAISLFTDLGTGQPGEHTMRATLTAMRLAGEDIPRSLRIAIVAREIVLWSGRGDAESRAVADVLADRRGRALDPTVVDVALADLPEFVIPSTGEVWDEAVSAEPSPRRI